MTHQHDQPSNIMETILRRAITAGLANQEEASEALTRLELAKTPDEIAAASYKRIKDDAHREAQQAAGAEPPQDELEVIQWMAAAASQAPWVKDAQAVSASPYATFPALMRVRDQDGNTFRLGISFCQDEENQEDFDQHFLG